MANVRQNGQHNQTHHRPQVKKAHVVKTMRIILIR